MRQQIPADLATNYDDDWLRFRLDEGLDVIAAYRSIANPSVRAMFIRLMKEAAQNERNGDPGLN